MNESIMGEATGAACFSLQGENGADSIGAEFGLDAAELSSLPMGAFVAVDALRRGQTRGRVF